MEGLLAAIQSLMERDERVLLGITGEPGAGKSTLAASLLDHLGSDNAVVLPMDGYHLAGAELERLGRAHRKGAIDTFDAHGFVHTLERIARQRGPGDDALEAVYAPAFDRDLEEPIAGAVAVSADHSVVIVEGNYLLAEQGPWGRIPALLSSTWFLSVGAELRQRRLIARHERHGVPPAAAQSHALGSDQVNAEFIASTATRADLIVEMPAG
ncbi:MAG TPA: nucleoside/nucleotide kinase family protein [Candidatus Nesterenkonia stercoripullorum]|uniref:Nucleoside/nucleotide kinase family protein n=1 Tax=Candidatus Nesterenkonia stercoripullorum TaxID=2838701 RepID=A0A9D1URV9_9MICC|nr:nucleoside/nucleotide kinase family protein [Candidatus Nesterenkonia stercoripullorum]